MKRSLSPALDQLWREIEQNGPGATVEPDFRFGTEKPTEESINGFLDGLVKQYTMRKDFRAKYGYAVPSIEAIDRIIEFADGPIVEIGAGRALWAHLIQRHGGKIRPTDLHARGRELFPGHDYPEQGIGETWTEVQQLDAIVAAEHATEPTLLTIWPAMDTWAHEALLQFKGERVVYVGEWDACTADPAFHETLSTFWHDVGTCAIPRWFGLHDRVHFFIR